jgi:hypothetical protein
MGSSIKESIVMLYSANPKPSLMDSHIKESPIMSTQDNRKRGAT